MAESARQKRITGRVMHEFKHGELKSGPGGKGGPVKSRRQAIAIALEEAGASKYESDRRNRRNLRRTERKEAEGKTGQQEREGRSHVGASDKRESTRSMGGKNAKRPTVRGQKAAAALLEARLGLRHGSGIGRIELVPRVAGMIHNDVDCHGLLLSC
jgi:hypothetical protein